MTRPYLKWVGGKTQLLPQIRSRLPESFKDYHEPFIGGGAVFFDLRPAVAHLSDTSPRLITTHQMVRDRPQEVADALAQYSGVMPEETYYRIRDRLNQSTDPLETAVCFLLINFTGFNGLYRENSKGGCNTPWGGVRKLSDGAGTTQSGFPTLGRLQECSQALQRASITRQDFRQALAKVQPGDFVYLDPPYVPLSKTSSFAGYAKGGFGPQDQEDLVTELTRLDKLGARFLLSNSDTEVTRDLYKDFRIDSVEASRNVSAKTEGRAKVLELLVCNYKAKPPPSQKALSLEDWLMN